MGVSEESAADAGVLQGLTFLVGGWRGEGTWSGAPFSALVDWLDLPGGHLFGQIHSLADGREREEHVVLHTSQDGAEALVLSDAGEAQRFEVQELEPSARYRFVFSPPDGSDLSPQRWTIERTATGYRERFEIARDGRFDVSVECDYVPDEEIA